MKTLDEVITANECCDHGEPDSRCEDCPYNGIGACCAERESDELQYLKTYRENQQTYIENSLRAEEARERYLEAIKNCELTENKYKRLWEETSQKLRNTSQITCPKCHSEFVILPEANNALTWDELRQMEGKPVWVERCDGDTKGWLLILRKCDDVVTCTTKHGNSFYLYKANYGEKWQAYRKERE